jgi:DNA-binding response OmpR family regulator
MRLLLVEDDRYIAGFLQKGLQEAGYVVEWAADGEEGFQRAVAFRYDAAIIDLMLPGKDGLSVIEGMRARGVDTPVLILSARRTVDDRVLGLQTGGDDYMVKPFAIAELIARLQALLRRRTGGSEPMQLTIGPISVNLLTREVRRAGRTIDLQPREFSLLEYLM